MLLLCKPPPLTTRHRDHHHHHQLRNKFSDAQRRGVVESKTMPLGNVRIALFSSGLRRSYHIPSTEKHTFVQNAEEMN